MSTASAGPIFIGFFIGVGVAVPLSLALFRRMGTARAPERKPREIELPLPKTTFRAKNPMAEKSSGRALSQPGNLESDVL